MVDGRCIFCGSIGDLTAEHPMSKRVLDLAGFGLDDVSIEIDVPLKELTVDYVAERMKTIREEAVRCVCADGIEAAVRERHYNGTTRDMAGETVLCASISLESAAN